MPHWKDAAPLPNTVSIALTLYAGSQTTQCKFPLRNLPTVEADYLRVVRALLDEVASELYYITSCGVSKGIVRVGGKKVWETVYLDYVPREDLFFFPYGVKIKFSPVYTYQWVKGQQQARRLVEATLNDDWQRQVVEQRKTAYFRLPCYPAGGERETPFFFKFSPAKTRKRRRKKHKWQPQYEYDDPIFNRFITRFYENGHLAFGQQRYWGKVGAQYLQISGISWPFPKQFGTKSGRKSQADNQTTDETEYVYLIRMGQSAKYKIGKSSNPQGRLATLQTANPDKLELLHTFKADNTAAAEEALHGYLHDVRLAGEWFKLSDEQRERILSITKYENYHFYVGDKMLRVDALFDSVKGK